MKTEQRRNFCVHRPVSSMMQALVMTTLQESMDFFLWYRVQKSSDEHLFMSNSWTWACQRQQYGCVVGFTPVELKVLSYSVAWWHTLLIFHSI